MVATESLLSGLREKLLATAGALPVRVVTMQGSPDGVTCRVCVEVRRPDGPILLFFFRHGDGTWHVFPPAHNLCSMGF